MWHVWNTAFNDVVDRHAPLRTRRAWSSKSPWVTPVLRQRMREIDILKIKAIQPKDPNHYKFAFSQHLSLTAVCHGVPKPGAHSEVQSFLPPCRCCRGKNAFRLGHSLFTHCLRAIIKG